MKPLAFAKLAKFDETTGYFEAVATDESVDATGEVCDYATSAPLFQAWSDTIKVATGGKSVGNVRAMHKAVAAGLLNSIEFDDAAKAIKVSGFAVDPVEKMKLAKGCYTGLSIGGNLVGEMWEDPVMKGVNRYTCQPTEISLVDFPCNGNAFFTVVKDGGGAEIRKFIEPGKGGAVQKSMWTVSRLADLVQSLAYVADDCAYEASWELDQSPIPGELRDAMKNLGAILVRMVTEEVAELTEDDVIALAAKDTIGKVAKFFPSLQRTEDAAMDAELKKNHDAAVAKLATTEADLAKVRGEVDTITKARDEAQAQVTKLQAENTEFGELLQKAADRMDADAKVIAENKTIVEKFNAMPAPMKAAVRAVTKGQDITTDAPEVTPVFEADGVTVNKAATAISHALQNPVQIHR